MFVTLRCTFIFRVFYTSGKTAKIKYDYKFVFILTFFFQNRKWKHHFFKINFNPTLLVQNIVSF